MKSKNYDEFVEKFKPKKTTDDCYTPLEIYEAIKEWVYLRYGINIKNHQSEMAGGIFIRKIKDIRQ